MESCHTHNDKTIVTRMHCNSCGKVFDAYLPGDGKPYYTKITFSICQKACMDCAHTCVNCENYICDNPNTCKCFAIDNSPNGECFICEYGQSTAQTFCQMHTINNVINMFDYNERDVCKFCQIKQYLHQSEYIPTVE